MTLRCFMIVPIDRVQLISRRWSEAACKFQPKGYGHDASLFLGEGIRALNAEQVIVTGRDAISKGDQETFEWPTVCDCGYVFTDADELQIGEHRLYEGLNHARFTLARAPEGAMWHAPWLLCMGPRFNRAGDPKGPLFVRGPGRKDWNIDGPANNGEGWTRSGEPPLVTVNPSIQVPGYHGHLRDGVFSEPV